MKIPFTPYQLGHVRKALIAGATTLIGSYTSIANAGLPRPWEIVALVGTFLVPALAVFGVKNKDLGEALAVIEGVDPSLVPPIVQETASVVESATADVSPATESTPVQPA